MEGWQLILQALGIALLNVTGWCAIWYRLGKLEALSHEHRRCTERPVEAKPED